jgi:1,4-dihydroxy-2-naphthoate polyprenyltransferase
MNIIFVHSFLDLIPDKHVGKTTLAVKINNIKLNLVFLILINSLPYVTISFGIYNNYLSHYYWSVFLLLPVSASLIYLMIKYVTHPDKEFSPIFLMGPTKDYNYMKKLGNGWFMIRWLLARNLTVYFSIIIIILALINK